MNGGWQLLIAGGGNPIDWRGGVLLIDYEEIVESCPLKLEGRIL